MTDFTVEVVENRVVVEVAGADALLPLAIAASADAADRAEAALAEIEDIASGAPDAPSILNKMDKAANLSDVADVDLSRENIGAASTDDLLEKADKSTLISDVGATQIGTDNGLTVQARLDLLAPLAYASALANPPFATTPGDYGFAVPNSTDPVKVMRTNENYITARHWRSWGGFDEFTWRYVTGPQFDGGWVMWAHRVFAFGVCWSILVQPEDRDYATATECAFRLGLIGTDVYPDDYLAEDINGLGMHGNMSKKGTKLFLLDGGGDNMEPAANFEPGTILTGSTWVMTEEYDLLYRGGSGAGDPVATLNFQRSCGVITSIGTAEVGTFEADVANVGFQDSPAPMLATNTGSLFDRALICNNPVPVPLVGSGGQKGTMRVTDPNRSNTLRLFPSTFPTIAATVQALRGPFIGKGPAWDELAPYAGNRYHLAHVTDQDDFAKATAYMASAEEVAPKNAEPMTLGKQFQFYTARGTEYNAAGWG